MDIPLDEVVYFDCIVSTPATGAAVDADSTPTFAVYEEATDTDIGVGGNLTKRTSLTGNYRGSFTASTANGFEAGKWYSVIASAVVGGVTGKVVARSFRIVAAEAVAGSPAVDVQRVYGSSVSASALSDAAQNYNNDGGFKAVNSSLAALATAASVSTLSSIFSGITSLAQWLGLMAGKQTGNTTARTELRATGAGSGTFDETTDALEAVRDRGDAAWVTGSSGGDATLANQNTIIALINPARCIAVNPVSEDDNITLHIGDDYSTSDTGRALQWSATDADLTAGTVQMAYMLTSAYELGGSTWTSIGSGSVTAYSAGVNTIKVTLTAAETTALTTVTPPANEYAYTYRLRVTLSGRVRTEFKGGMTVKN